MEAASPAADLRGSASPAGSPSARAGSHAPAAGARPRPVTTTARARRRACSRSRTPARSWRGVGRGSRKAELHPVQRTRVHSPGAVRNARSLSPEYSVTRPVAPQTGQAGTASRPSAGQTSGSTGRTEDPVAGVDTRRGILRRGPSSLERRERLGRQADRVLRQRPRRPRRRAPAPDRTRARRRLRRRDGRAPAAHRRGAVAVGRRVAARDRRDGARVLRRGRGRHGRDRARRADGAVRHHLLLRRPRAHAGPVHGPEPSARCREPRCAAARVSPERPPCLARDGPRLPRHVRLHRVGPPGQHAPAVVHPPRHRRGDRGRGLGGAVHLRTRCCSARPDSTASRAAAPPSSWSASGTCWPRSPAREYEPPG